MSKEIIELLSASDHAVPLRDLLMYHLDINEDTYKREASGTSSALEGARLTVLRHIFGAGTPTPSEGNRPAQAKALVWIRRQRIGRLVRAELEELISATRYTYENNPANEATRLLLLAYKQAKDILYGKDLGDVLC